MPQLSVEVLPTRSIYEFANEQVHVNLTFMTPMLPDKLDILTRPITYITWTVEVIGWQDAQHQPLLWRERSACGRESIASSELERGKVWPANCSEGWHGRAAHITEIR